MDKCWSNVVRSSEKALRQRIENRHKQLNNVVGEIMRRRINEGTSLVEKPKGKISAVEMSHS